jgi:hypothetical protein
VWTQRATASSKIQNSKARAKNRNVSFRAGPANETYMGDIVMIEIADTHTTKFAKKQNRP